MSIDNNNELDPIEREHVDPIVEPSIENEKPFENLLTNEPMKTETKPTDEQTTTPVLEQTPAKKPKENKSEGTKDKPTDKPTSKTDANKKDYTSLWVAGIALVLALLLIYLRQRNSRKLKEQNDEIDGETYID